MTPDDLLALTVRPVLAWMGRRYASTEAELALLAIAKQESGLRARRQKRGPARGLWQFEAGGIEAVLGHRSVGAEAERMLSDLVCMTPDPGCVRAVIELNDHVACVFARLLLWTDHHPLPSVGDATGAWACYLSLWRPGMPRPGDWPASYAAALAAVSPPALVA